MSNVDEIRGARARLWAAEVIGLVQGEIEKVVL